MKSGFKEKLKRAIAGAILSALLFSSNVQALTVDYLSEALESALPTKQNWADPTILNDNGTYYLSVTGGKLPIFRSENLLDWEYIGNAFTGPLNYKSLWAPDLSKHKSEYNLLLSAVIDGKRQIYATKTPSMGEYLDNNLEPVTEILDPHVFRDSNGVRWLSYTFMKDHAHHIGITRLSAQNEAILPSFQATNSTKLIDGISSCMGGTNGETPNNNCSHEGPFIIKRGEWYILFFSMNYWRSNSYTTGYKKAKSIECFNVKATCETEQGIVFDGTNESSDYTYGHGGLVKHNKKWYHAVTVMRKSDESKTWRKVWLVQQRFKKNGSPRMSVPQPSDPLEIEQ